MTRNRGRIGRRRTRPNLLILAAALLLALALAGTLALSTVGLADTGPPRLSHGHTAAYWEQRNHGNEVRRVRAERLLQLRNKQLREQRAVNTRGVEVAATIDKLLARYGSILTGYGAEFVAAGAVSHINPRLAVAISAAETTFCRSGGTDVYVRHNCWGWGPGKYIGATWPEAITAYTEYLSSYYVQARGLITIAAIEPVYVGYPSPGWMATVRSIYSELGGDPDASVYQAVCA